MRSWPLSRQLCFRQPARRPTTTPRSPRMRERRRNRAATTRDSSGDTQNERCWRMAYVDLMLAVAYSQLMADFRKPPGVDHEGYDVVANRQTLTVGRYATIALWGGGPKGEKLGV